jgi:hypothetical protein
MESQKVTPAAFVDADSEVAAERERCMTPPYGGARGVCV